MHPLSVAAEHYLSCSILTILASPRQAVSQQLSALEDWLYGDGEDVAKAVYTKKLQVRAWVVCGTRSPIMSSSYPQYT